MVKRPPGPRGLPLVGSALKRYGKPLEFFSHLARTYGDICYFSVFDEHFYFINHPDLIQQLLVTDAAKYKKGRALERAQVVTGNSILVTYGAEHRRKRKLLQPAFHHQRIVGYANAMASSAQKMADQWSACIQAEAQQQGNGEGGVRINISEEMSKLTLEIVVNTLFGTDLTPEMSHTLLSSVSTLMKTFNLRMLPFQFVFKRLGVPFVKQCEQAQKEMDSLIYTLIAERRKSGKDHGDLFSMLLQSQEEEGGASDALSDQEVRDETLTLFIAGHETTATALTWAWYVLARNSEARAMVEAEVEQVVGKRAITFHDVPQLIYSFQFIAETMRLYPPVWVLGRRAIEETELGGYTVPAGTIVIASQFVMGRDARYFSEPDQFDPARWTPEEKAKRPKFTYFPFGGGPRVCIAESFAWMEATLLFTTLVQRFRVEWPADAPEPGFSPQITLRSKYDLSFLVKERK